MAQNAVVTFFFLDNILTSGQLEFSTLASTRPMFNDHWNIPRIPGLRTVDRTKSVTIATVRMSARDDAKFGRGLEPFGRSQPSRAI